jgi:hypothetical protein
METIAAVVILAIGIPPMLWAIGDAHIQRVNPLLASRARWLATAKLEDVIADRHSGTRGYAYLVPSNYPAETPVAGEPAFSRVVSLTETGPDLITPGTGYTTVEIAVTWTDATATVRTLTVSTVLTEYGS